MAYQLLLIFFFPVIFIYSVKIALRYRSLTYLLQRFGFLYPVLDKQVIWLHCASVGEVNTAIPLVKSLLEYSPEQLFVITTTTPTGAKTVINSKLNNVTHCYLPVDMSFCVRRYLKRVKPSLALIMETELWPALYRQCENLNIPMTIVNGRLSKRTLKANNWLKKQYQLALARVDHVLARSESDRDGFIELACERNKIEVIGNLKFAPPGDIQVKNIANFTDRDYVLAASTHDDEELQLAKLWQGLDVRDRLLVIVPRHPERGKEIRGKLKNLGFDVALRSQNDSITDDTQIYIADTLGELVSFMAKAEIVFIGGSLIKHGGQNILEPARLARPIIIGPYSYNFKQEVELFVENKACVQVSDTSELATVINDLLGSQQQKDELSSRALELMSGHNDVVNQYRNKITTYYKDCFL